MIRFLMSVIVVIVMFMAIGYLVHGVILAQDYANISSLYRTQQEQQNHLPFMLLGHLFAAVAMVWLYRRLKSGSGVILPGLRFGIVMAALMVIPKFLTYFTIQPIPVFLVAKQIVLDTLGLIVIGIVVAWINKK